jgi:hypothetical protein
VAAAQVRSNHHAASNQQQQEEIQRLLAYPEAACMSSIQLSLQDAKIRFYSPSQTHTKGGEISVFYLLCMIMMMKQRMVVHAYRRYIYCKVRNT